MAAPSASPMPGGSGSLRASAPDFEPQGPRRDASPPVRPIRTRDRTRSGPNDLLAQLDAVPFTPSQGVCTPSPTNMAAMWVPHPHFYTQPAWGPMGGAYAGSPGPSSNGSDTSMLHGASQPGTPGGGMVWGGFQPLPFSPTALQIAAASGALGSDPSTPVRGRGGAPGAAAGAGAAPFLAVMPGSPMVPVSPGQMMFAQYFGGDGSSKHSHSPPESHHSSGSGDEGDGDSSAGSGSGLEVSDAARQIASAMCAAQQLPGEPPQQLLELASLLHAYGLVSAVPSAFPGPGAHSGPPSPQRQASPDARARRARQKAAPKLNPDGSVRLNARQRRTLRRAQERAMKALLEAQAKAHGISSEQAAIHLASIGVTSMLLGSPVQPAAAAPMLLHGSPVQGGYLAAPAGLLSPAPLMAQHADYGMLQAAAMMQQAGAAPGFDAGWAGAAAADVAGLAPAMAYAYGTPPRYAPGRASPGYAGQRSGGYRSGGRTMSRFAPADAVAAF